MRRTFEQRIDKSAGNDSCWIWTGRLDPNGYGRFDEDGKPRLAHRIAYFRVNPAADRSLSVLHSCDNPPCCNPAHLWLGTQLDNIADMNRKGRGRSSTRRGETSNKAKLSAEQALEIFYSPKPGNVLASEFGISSVAVYKIKRGENWAHVTGGRRAP